MRVSWAIILTMKRNYVKSKYKKSNFILDRKKLKKVNDDGHVKKKAFTGEKL